MPASVGNHSQPPHLEHNNHHSVLLILIQLVFMVACGQMAQTIFVPALPQIAHGLNADENQLQGIMAAYLLSYGLMQFIYGPISDRIGRKLPLIVGISIAILGALIAANANTVHLLIAASCLQGCGTAAAGALSRSIPRDHFYGERLVQFNSYVSMAVVFSPLIAPFAGSFTATHWGWHAVYYTLALFSFLVLMMIIFSFKESLPITQREPVSIITAYSKVLKHKAFCGYTLGLVATFAGIAAFEAIAGVLYGQKLKMTPFMVSLWFVAPIPGYLLGSLFAARSHTIGKLINRGIALLGAGALLLLIPGLFGLVIGWSILLGSVLFFTGAGILFPALTSAALEPFPRQAGIAGALLGGLQNFGAGIAALLMALLPMHGQFSIGIVCAMMVLIVVLALNFAKHHQDHLNNPSDIPLQI